MGRLENALSHKDDIQRLGFQTGLVSTMGQRDGLETAFNIIMITLE